MRSALDRAPIPPEFHEPSSLLHTARDPLPDLEQKQTALSYLSEAWADARHEGVDGDCLAQASLFTALAELVSTYGEDAVAKFVEGFRRPQRRVFDPAGEAVGPRHKLRRRHPRKRVIQYAAASRFNHWLLWNTGSPGQAGR
jgi:hypothetical protein